MYDPNIQNPEAFNLINNKLGTLNFKELENNNSSMKNHKILTNHVCSKNLSTEKNIEKPNMKKIWNKLSELKINLKMNNASDKKSACFWCTYEFDNPVVFIPKQYSSDNMLEVYGCFCSPECAVAYLKNEDIDNSTKWERYALLNNIYSKVFDYEKNIKPAPNPFYTLDKYYGNLTINEYRKLLQNENSYGSRQTYDKNFTRII